MWIYKWIYLWISIRFLITFEAIDSNNKMGHLKNCKDLFNKRFEGRAKRPILLVAGKDSNLHDKHPGSYSSLLRNISINSDLDIPSSSILF